MANNPYVNKVVFGSTTLIDISDTTAVAADVASGKYFYTAAGAKVQGTGSGGIIDGDNLAYGGPDSPIVGAGVVGQMVL